MGKPYINNAVIGNGSMLGCVSETGELIRLYWPEIDFPQHIEKLLTGFFDRNVPNSTVWFSEGDYEYSQAYIEGTNILKTVARIKSLSLEVVQTDFCVPCDDVLVRRYSIKNIGRNGIHLGVGVASRVTSHTLDMGCTLFDFGLDALVHYRHDNYWAIVSDAGVKEFQIGNDPFRAVWEGRLDGTDSIGMSPDGALLWDLGYVEPGCERNITLYMIFSRNMNSLKELTRKIKSVGYTSLFNTTKEYWTDYLSKCRVLKTGNGTVDRIYLRSLLLFRLMTDRNTGAILASPEIDENFTRCGRYAYCWVRDGAFITSALNEAGLCSLSEKFYEWSVRVQDKEGFWHQRYHINGNVAPSWGLQIDETGSILFGMWNHFLHVKNVSFLEKVWPAVLKACEFLENFIDGDTGLPLPSFDIWEERMGEHTYSTAAVIAGFRAAANIAETLGVSKKTIDQWRSIADNIKKALERNLVDNAKGIFLRSIRTKLNPWGSEPCADTVIITVNPKGYTREVSAFDGKMDISLLGAAVPFGIYEPRHPVMRNTAEKVEKLLYCEKAGGIYRYQEDGYAGGNPWVVATLWLAMYHIRAGNIEKAREYFHWSVECATPLGFLPEQAGKNDGKPCWVIPLTWSHAMFVLVLKELAEKGGIGDMQRG
ncbi:glycoside hydrolase family 15 [Thermoclostridium stercorarium subsp. stercorarium DSM 8532]|uniref:Glycoside hydrolase family 15 n=1 Tax=Thermoclostridium stercorarium (strain ATCC 35414 / DSM 8532 / NCIMB 11754) TaxID=1121335 RepID=L7VP22_THES1|nr:glycoside hydrolase family 15 protein [Thermoclostridium stercorarium]AGC67293.1 glycoside hydrolase family 15 [Thermoclostridium stercorarium subsp. stercorarium DSM 8532]AGI38358.1 amylase [Thermoclostridium stercorarium subsp. stercorarium DSM 8532]UZQ85868.1 glycoside hydrolase family 15 protein [Thermoclostridium stercorarium]